ncbi:MAG: phosphatase PAP2 family protein [Alphaproteobacteria bacterium]|nr:phosphatase PAP2 family protein [Alphaproteobacteria bacterium]
MRTVVFLLLGSALAGFVWIAVARPFTVATESLLNIGQGLALLFVARALCARPARTRLTSGLIAAIDALLVLTVMFPATIVLAYLSTTAAAPLIDPILVRADAFLGFHSGAAAGVTEALPALAWAKRIAYFSFGPQIIAVSCALAVMAGQARFCHFVFAFMVSALACIAVNMVWPAVGAYVHFGLDCAAFPNLAPAPACVFLGDVLALREGSFETLHLAKAQGILTFPSFHTVLGVLVWHYSRDLGPLCLPLRVLNVMMIASAVTVGGHYLADVLAGIALALATIRATDALARRLEAGGVASRPAPVTSAQSPLAEGGSGR